MVSVQSNSVPSLVDCLAGQDTPSTFLPVAHLSVTTFCTSCCIFDWSNTRETKKPGLTKPSTPTAATTSTTTTTRIQASAPAFFLAGGGGLPSPPPNFCC